MLVNDAMSSVVLTIGPSHTLRYAAKRMSDQRVGAAVVHDDDGQGPSILTERDILDAVAASHDMDAELAGDHLTQRAVVADTQRWTLQPPRYSWRLRMIIASPVGCDSGPPVPPPRVS